MLFRYHNLLQRRQHMEQRLLRQKQGGEETGKGIERDMAVQVLPAGREQHHAEGERQRRDFAAVEGGEGVDVGFERGRRDDAGAGGSSAEPERGCGDDETESASLRMSAWSPARRPDHFRHSRCAPRRRAPLLLPPTNH
mgnify:CR=1 FL=1